jgi:tetratricopeptide (TPR) repeat protein
MDDEDRDFEPEASRVAAALAQLELARRTGRSGAIGLAHLNLAATLAAVGDHAAAAAEYAGLIDYLDLAASDSEAETQRWLRIASAAAPPPTAEDIDPAQLQAFARIRRADSLLLLGRRAEAAADLDAAAPACRGFGRGRLRKELKAVRQRMAAATDPGPVAAAPGAGPVPGTATSLAEQVAAADELLGEGRPQEAARVALQAISRCGEGDVAARARARQVLGMALEAMGQPGDALSVLGDSFTDYISADQPVEAARIAIPLAWRQSQSDRVADAVALLRQALAFTESAGVPALRAQLLTDLGSLLDQQQDPVAAKAAFTAALSTAEPLGETELAANARHGLAVVLANAESADRQDEVEALSLLESCRGAYDQLGLLDRVAGCEHETAALLGRLGSWEAARNRYVSALAAYRRLPESDRDTGSWPDEVADVQRNLAALVAGATGEPGLFQSGGHAMSHRAPHG